MKNPQFRKDISNVISQVTKQHKKKKQYFICCLCPECKTIFTISIAGPAKYYGGVYNNCPVCNERHDWCFYRISKTVFKFIRWWRTKETPSEWFMHEILRRPLNKEG